MNRLVMFADDMFLLFDCLRRFACTALNICSSVKFVIWVCMRVSLRFLIVCCEAAFNLRLEVIICFLRYHFTDAKGNFLRWTIWMTCIVVFWNKLCYLSSYLFRNLSFMLLLTHITLFVCFV